MNELLQYDFVLHALLASLLVSILCGLVGTYVVTRRLVFIGGGIAHSSLGGVGLGAYFGFSPLGGAALFALLSAYGIKALSRRREVRQDSAIALLWTVGMSLGIMFSFLSPGFAPELQSYLFGSILTVTVADLWMLAALTAVVVAGFTLFLRPIVGVAFDAMHSRTLGLPVAFIEYALLSVVALTIVCSLRLVGIVMVIALLSVPQMAANLCTQSFCRMAWLSVALSLLGCWGGLALSFSINVPSGASIIFVSVLIYAVIRAIKQLFLVLNKKPTT